MPCACNANKKKSGPASWTVTDPHGKQTAYRTEVEAQRAAVRVQGTVRPAT